MGRTPKPNPRCLDCKKIVGKIWAKRCSRCSDINQKKLWKELKKFGKVSV